MEVISTKERPQDGIWEAVRTIIYAVLIALILRTLSYEPFNIPSSSMKPTLEIGDYLFVSKFSYGYSHHSLPLSLKLFSGRILYTQPERGDVLVFKEPRDNRTDYIKRVIGLPGDRVQLQAGLIYLNGVPVERQPVADYELYTGRLAIHGGRPTYVRHYIETLPGGRSYRVIEERECRADGSACGPHDNMQEITVPPGHFLMMGDNRDNSSDGREWGFVPAENLIGRAVILFLSFKCESSCYANWWEVWKWPLAIRWSRIFQMIE